MLNYRSHLIIYAQLDLAFVGRQSLYNKGLVVFLTIETCFKTSFRFFLYSEMFRNFITVSKFYNLSNIKFYSFCLCLRTVNFTFPRTPTKLLAQKSTIFSEIILLATEQSISRIHKILIKYLTSFQKISKYFVTKAISRSKTLFTRKSFY